MLIATLLSLALRPAYVGSRRPGMNAAVRAAVVVAALAALLWQSVLVQTHVHYPSAAVHAATVASYAGQPGDTPGDCTICQELAQAGAYLTPVLVPLPVPAPACFVIAQLPIVTAVLVTFAPAWRSRAPPLARPV